MKFHRLFRSDIFLMIDLKILFIFENFVYPLRSPVGESAHWRDLYGWFFLQRRDMIFLHFLSNYVISNLKYK
jgi:hypothetical protein